MPRKVNIPGVGVVRFPDEMDDAAITKAIETEISPSLALPKGKGNSNASPFRQKMEQRGQVIPLKEGDNNFDASKRVDVPVQTGDNAFKFIKGEAPRKLLVGTGERLLAPVKRMGGGLAEIFKSLSEGPGGGPIRPGQTAGGAPSKSEVRRGLTNVVMGAGDAAITALMPGITAAGAAGAEMLDIPDVSVSEQSAAGIAEGLRKIFEGSTRFKLKTEEVRRPQALIAGYPAMPAMESVGPLEMTAGALETAMGAITPTSKFLNLLTKAGPLAEESEFARTAMAPATEYFKPTTEEGQYAAEIGDFALPLGFDAILRSRRKRPPLPRRDAAFPPKGEKGEGKLKITEETTGEFIPPSFRRRMLRELVKQGEVFERVRELDDAGLEKLYTERGLNKRAAADEAPGSAGRGTANQAQIDQFIAEGRMAPFAAEKRGVSPEGGNEYGVGGKEGEREINLPAVEEILASIEGTSGKVTDLDVVKGTGGKKKYSGADPVKYPLINFMVGKKIKPENTIDVKRGRMVTRGEYYDTPRVFVAKGKEEGMTLSRAAEQWNEMLPEGAEHLTDSEFLEKLNDEAFRYEGKGSGKKFGTETVSKAERIVLSKLSVEEQQQIKELAEPIAGMVAHKYGWGEGDLADAITGVLEGKGSELKKLPQRLLQDINNAIAMEGIGFELEGVRQFVSLDELKKENVYRVGEETPPPPPKDEARRTSGPLREGETGRTVEAPASRGEARDADYAFAVAGAVPFLMGTGNEDADNVLKGLGTGSVAVALAMLGRKKGLSKSEIAAKEFLKEKLKKGLPGEGESVKFGEVKRPKGAGKELPSEKEPLKPEGKGSKITEKEFTDAKRYNYIGIRTLSKDEKYKVGDRTRKSRDGADDSGNPELNGTSATIVNNYNLESLSDLLNRIEESKIKHAYGEGKLVLIGGDRMELGQDKGEIVIGNAKVIGYLNPESNLAKPKVIKEPIAIKEPISITSSHPNKNESSIVFNFSDGTSAEMPINEFQKLGYKNAADLVLSKKSSPDLADKYSNPDQTRAPEGGALTLSAAEAASLPEGEKTIIPTEKTSLEPPEGGGQFNKNLLPAIAGATALGTGAYLAASPEPPPKEGDSAPGPFGEGENPLLFAAGIMAAGIRGKMTPKVRGVFDSMQRHVRGLYEQHEIRGGQLGEALRAVAKEYVEKGDGRFLPVEEQRQILGASGGLNKALQRKMMTRDYKAQMGILEYARKLELGKQREFDEAQARILHYGKGQEVKTRKRLEREDLAKEKEGKEGDARTSLLQANWVTKEIWDGIKDEVLNELNRNKEYAGLGAFGREKLFDTVNKYYEERVKSSIEAITGGAHGLGPDMYSLSGGGATNPYSRYKDLTIGQARNMDLYMATERVFGEDFPMAKKGILDPLDDAKGGFADEVRARVRRMNNYVVKELGIKNGSRESAVVQNLGEGAKFFEFDKQTGKLLSDNSLTGRMKRAIGMQGSLPLTPSKGGGNASPEPPRGGGEAARGQMPLGNVDPGAIPAWLEANLGPGAKIITDMERQDGRVGETILVSMPYTFADAVRDLGMEKAKKAVQAAEYFRDEYNNMLGKINQSYSRIYQGQPDKLVRKRKDYFRHFNELQNDLGGLLNIFETPEVIDSRLAGISADTEPKRRWQSFAQRRFGVISKEDAVGGYLNYVPSAAHAMHIDPMIQRLRGFAKVLAESTVKKPNLNRYIELVRDVANELAGKTDTFDRGWMSRVVGRTGMRSINRFNNLIKANAVMANLGSALIQPANVVNGYASLGKGAEKHLALGIRDAFVDMLQGNKKSNANSFMSERYLDKDLDALLTGIMGGHVVRNAKRLMRVGDEVTARVLWHSFYNKAMAEGIADPGRYAGWQVRKNIGGRGLAEVSAADRSKVIRLILPLQREVRNTWLLMKDAAHRRDMMWVGRFVVSSFVMNQIYRQIFGESRTLDLGGALMDAFKMLDESDESTQVAVAQSLGRIGGEFLSNIPAGQLLTEQFMPEGVRRKYLGKSDPSRFGTGVGLVPSLGWSFWKGGTNLLEGEYDRAGNEALNIGSKVLLPFGGGQVKKTLKGLAALKEGGVENDTGYESFEDILDQMRAVTLGPGQTQAARRLYGR